MAGRDSGHPPSTTDEQTTQRGVDVPPPPNESCRDRETVRLPRTTSRALQDLVDDGTYPNRAAAIRAGIRALVAAETDGAWPPESTGETDEEPRDAVSA